MVELVRKFIKAERLGDWDVHIQSLYEMLSFFAASGHRFYMKSVHIYLQKMAKLPEQHLKSTSTSKKASMAFVGLIAVGLGYPQT